MPRRAKPIAIDLAELVQALEDHSGLSWYLDANSGELLPVSDDMDDEGLAVPRAELEESPRFIFIEPIESRLGWEDMRDFIETVGGRHLRELLALAIAGKGAFGRFREVLAGHPAERARWFAEHDRRMQDRARQWLEAHHIAWTVRPSPAGPTAPAEHVRSAAPEHHDPAKRARAGATGNGRCQLCARRDLDGLWVEVHPEVNEISSVTVDVTMRLCPEHRRRLLEAIGREDAVKLDPPKHDWR